MPLKPKFKARLISILRKFKLSELKSLLPVVYPHISVNIISKVLDEHLRLPPTSLNLANALVYIYEHSAPSIEDCDATLCQILVLDAAFHSSHTWNAVELKTAVSELPEQLNDLENIIKRSYRTKASNANVKSVFHDNIIWSVVAERIILKKGGVKLGSPQFFAFNPHSDVPHLLFSPKTRDTDTHLQIYLESMGYSGYELMDFEGKNVGNMIQSMERVKNKRTDIIALPQFESGCVVRRSGWMDYSLELQRQLYAHKIFSHSSDRKCVTVECEGFYSDQTPNASTLNEFYSTMEFKVSRKYSIEEMFEHLVTVGAVHFPLPNYMFNICSSISTHLSTQEEN